MSQTSRRALFAALVLTLLPLVSVVWPLAGQVSPASADAAPSITLCSGFDKCAASGRGHGGYKTAKSKMYWNMYSGVNCTNYVAYRMISAGMSSTRPSQLKPGVGNATYWGGSFGSATNATPTVGSVAWWKANTNGVGSAGHVARVEQVLASGDIVISESNYGSEFTWRQIAKGGNRWPSGFIHLKDTAVASTAAPSVAGTITVGAVATAKVGSWSVTPTAYAYQWFAGGVAIPGATASTLALTAAQVGKALQVRVTAGRTGYVNGAGLSAASAPVQPGTQVVTNAPAVAGVPQVDEVLTANPGSYSPGAEATTLQWLADGAAIPGATTAKFVPTPAQANARISLRVTAVKAGYKALVKVSSPTAPVVAPAIRTAASAITGTRLVGQVLTANATTVPATATKAFYWFRDGKRIVGANGPTYKLKMADVGHEVSAKAALSAKGFVPGTLVVGPVKGIQVPVAGNIKTTAAGSNSVWVKVTFRGSSGTKPTGRVAIKVGNEVRKGTLTKNGAVKLHFTHPGAGTKTINVTYAGTSTFVSTRLQGTVKVPAKKVATKKKAAKKASKTSVKKAVKKAVKK